MPETVTARGRALAALGAAREEECRSADAEYTDTEEIRGIARDLAAAVCALLGLAEPAADRRCWRCHYSARAQDGRVCIPCAVARADDEEG